MRRWLTIRIWRASGVRDGFGDEDWILWKRVAGRQWDLPHVVFVAAAVGEPVAGHELDPGGGQHVQRGGWCEAVARQQLHADGAWVGLHDLGFGIGEGELV